MKLLVRGLLAGASLVAGLFLAGCSSPSPDQFLLDNPQPVASAGPGPVADNQQTSAPSNSADVARYRVGDTVVVTYSDTPPDNPIPPYEETIKEDGTITPPLIGPVHAAGKTAGELQKEIHDDYVPKYFVRLNITVGSGDRVYYVGGEVHNPGRQLYVGDTTVTKAIQSAGGLTDFANHDKVWLMRATGGKPIRVNYDQALQDPSKDPPVYPNDQINVAKRIF